MQYKTISTVLTQPTRTPTHLDCAAQIAGLFDAHLDVLCMGIDRSRPEFAFPEAIASYDTGLVKAARDDAESLTKIAEARMGGIPLKYETYPVLVTPGGMSTVIGEATTLSDLIILPRPYGKETVPEDEYVAEAALFNGPTPVMFFPLGQSQFDLSGPVVIGWNGSSEALSAIRAAMPFLQQAPLVHIAMVAPPMRDSERSDPGGKLAQMLVRHGVKAEVWVLAQTLPRASDELLRHAKEHGAAMLVMGAYGHSRLREAVFGGATRSMLTKCTLPLLMAR